MSQGAIVNPNRAIPRFRLNNVTPFTYRDGYTFLEVLEELRRYITNTIVPGIDANFDAITQNYLDALNQLQSQYDGFTDIVDGKYAELDALYDQYMADVSASLRALNEPEVAALINDDASTVSVALKGKYVRKNELAVNVRDYGATGDGATDDTAAIQAAMDSLSPSGGTLLIPAGVYWLRNPVFLRSGVHIEGRGWPTLIRKPGDPYYAFFVSLSNGSRGYGSGASNWSCKGIEFRGTFGPLERSAGPFALHHAQNAVIEGNRFIECQIKGHVIDLNGCDNITIHNNVFAGMKLSGGDGIAEAIQLDQSKNGSLSYADSAGSYDGLMSRNITISQNQFLPLEVDGVWYPAGNVCGNHTTREGVYYENIKIIDNYIEDPIQGSSATWRGNIHLQGAKGVEILRNRWVSTKGGNLRIISLHTVEVGNDLTNDPEIVTPVSAIPPQGCIDVRIEGNVFEGFDGSAAEEHQVYVRGIETSPEVMRNIQIVGNTWRGALEGSSGSELLRVWGAEGVDISGNRFAGDFYRAFRCNNVQSLQIVGNHAESSVIQLFWVEACSQIAFAANSWRNTANMPRFRNCTGLTIHGNFASEPKESAPALVFEGCSFFTVTGNTFWTPFTPAAAITLSGTNTEGHIAVNGCFGYVADVQGTGTNVVIEA